ncbi:MAG: response regulator transcription factor [Muribaculaceae bacterium]|nr:response regulator transcription factor [Muribaculaceae bacterium]
MTDRSALRKMKIAVVDDHELVREGLKAVLSKHGINDVEKFGTATELVAAIDGGKSFDFYIIDLELPDIDGFVLIEMIRARNASARIIVSTVHDEIWTLRKLLARDVNAVIYKSVDGIEVIDAMVDILTGKNYYCKGVRNALKEAADQSLHPTDRELEVLYQISQGKTSREIAAAMFVTDNTIEAHRKALFSKLGAVNVADLIVKAIERGYLTKNGGKSNLA